MRAGGCTVQQALTPEAASIVKQAVSLARRRGHAQVTPLHVANAMLSSPTGLLRTACLQSHSHPLQCKALELCFNVALNRLPASSSSGPMLGPHQHHHHPPSLSNALVAAFKRAQAHQRRGSIESQQQPLLAVKIELEQLIISILDDPSVSRVMREAGFSSPQVKSNVEQAVSLDICAPTSSNPSLGKPKEGSSLLTPPQATKQRPLEQARSEDVMSVLETLVSWRKRSVVVVGECLATTEVVMRGVMDRVEKGEVPEALRNLQFKSLPLFSLRHMGREEGDQKVGELRCLVKGCCVGRGAVLYLGDLKWAAEYKASCGEEGRGYYCPVEHMIMEIGRLVCGGIGGEEGSGGRFWLMGIATYQTYMKCRVGHPSLETLWGLQPLSIPADSLGLSLNCDSNSQSELKSKRSGDGPLWSLMEDVVENQLTCCADCSIKFENEARDPPNISSSSHGSFSSSLPSWLRQYKEENRRGTNNDQECLRIRDLCKKWNSICNSVHKHQHQSSEMTPLHVSSASPSSSSISSYDLHYTSLHQTHHPWPVPLSAKHPWREQHFWMSETVIDEGFESNSRSYLQYHKGRRSSHLFCSNPTTNHNSTCSSDSMEMEYLHKFKELNAENLKTLCNALEKKVSWQKDIVPDIASTILRCRSGMMRRREKSMSANTKEDTWLFFHGGDIHGKEKIARELANLVFGSYTSFISIGLSNFSSTRSDSSDELRNKRSRAEASHCYLERFVEAIRDNPHRVIMMEDIEQVDYYSQMGVKTAIERGTIQSSNGEDLSVSDAIIILSCESFDSRSRACSPPVKQKPESEDEKEEESDKEDGLSICLDLNICAEDVHVGACSWDDVGLLEAVDRAFFFKLPEDL